MPYNAPHTDLTTMDWTLALKYHAFFIMSRETEYLWSPNQSISPFLQSDYENNITWNDTDPKPSWSEIEACFTPALEYLIETGIEPFESWAKTVYVHDHNGLKDASLGILSAIATLNNLADTVENLPEPVQPDWTQATDTALDFIKNKPAPRTHSIVSRSLNSAFQISTTRDAVVTYTVDVGCTISLTTGQTGTVILEIADNSGFTTNVQTVQQCANGNTGTLTLGLNLTQTFSATLSGYIPAGKYVRLRTVNTTGAPSFTYRAGQEALL